MTTTSPASRAPVTTGAPSPGGSAAGRGELRRALALARTELILLRRNRTAFFTALLMPLFFVAMFAALPNGLAGPPAVLGMVLGSALLFVVYYTLVTTVVARREQHTLKRLYTSSARPGTILVGMGLPLLGLLLVQVAVGVVAVAATSGLGDPPRLWLLLPAVLGGAAVWWVLALLSAVATRTVEAAQLTTLPLILVALLLSGLSLPLALLPDGLQVVAQLTPMFPVVDLVCLAFDGVQVTGSTVADGALVRAVLVDLAVLAAWVLLGLQLVRRTFRWEPRR